MHRFDNAAVKTNRAGMPAGRIGAADGRWVWNNQNRADLDGSGYGNECGQASAEDISA